MDWLMIITACFAVAFGITLYFLLQRKKDEKMFAEALFSLILCMVIPLIAGRQLLYRGTVVERLHRRE